MFSSKMKLKHKYTARMSDGQKMALGEYLKSYPQLISSKFTPNFQKSDARILWVKLAKRLNTVPGTKKNWEQWRRCWHDLRKAILGKAELDRKKIKVIYMSPTEQFIYKIIQDNKEALEDVDAKNETESGTIEDVFKCDPDDEVTEDPFGTLENTNEASQFDEDEDDGMPSDDSPDEGTLNGEEDNEMDEEIEKIASRAGNSYTETRDMLDRSNYVNRAAEEVLKTMKEQAKADREYREAHLRILEKQARAMEAMAEESRRHSRNYERQLEVQIELTKTLGQILLRLKK